MDNGRRALRLEIRRPARLFHVMPSGALRGQFTGELQDLSSGGFALRTRESLRPSATVYVEVDLDGVELAADAVVVRTIGNDQYGMAFVNLSHLAAAQITKYVFTQARWQAETTKSAQA